MAISRMKSKFGTSVFLLANAVFAGLAVGVLAPSANEEAQAQNCFMLTPTGETVGLDGICGSSIPSLPQNTQPREDTCNNLTAYTVPGGSGLDNEEVRVERQAQGDVILERAAVNVQTVAPGFPAECNREDDFLSNILPPGQELRFIDGPLQN